MKKPEKGALGLPSAPFPHPCLPLRGRWREAPEGETVYERTLCNRLYGAMPTQWSEAEQVPLGCIAPYATAAPWHQTKGTFRAPARGTFAPGGKSTQKRRSNLRFENPLRAFACRLSCLSLPRERCAMQISPKCCIVSAPLSAAAFALKYRRTSFYRGRDQRQRRRRRDDPFDRTTKSNSRDRAVKIVDNHAV